MTHPRIARLVVGDYGTVIYTRLEDEDGTPLDPANAVQPITATVVRPDGTEEEIELAASTDAAYPATPDANIDGDPVSNPTTWQLAGGWTEYIVPQYLDSLNPTLGPWLDQAGMWVIRPLYELASPSSQARAPVTADNQFWVEP